MLTASYAAAETVRVPFLSLPEHVNPVEAVEESGVILSNQVFEGLFVYDSENNLKPLLAESFCISPDGKTYNIKLRRGLRFSDGHPLAAAGVKLSLENAARVMGKASRWALGSISGFGDFIDGRAPSLSGIATPQKYELQIKLDRPYHPLLQVFATAFFRITEKSGGEYLGTGPYYVASRTPDNVTLKILPARAYQTPVDEIVAEKVASREAMTSPQALKRYDVIELAGKAGVSSPYHNRIDAPLLDANVLVFNTRRPALRDPDFRRSIVRLLRASVDYRAFGWQSMAQGFPFAKDLFGPETAQPYFSGPAHPLRIDYDDCDLSVSDVKVLQRRLRAAGHNIVFNHLSTEQLVKEFQSGNFDAQFSGFIPDIVDPDGLFTPLFGTGEQFNFAGYSSPEMDALLAGARAEQDFSKRMKIYSEIARKVERDAPIGFIGSSKLELLVSKKFIPPKMNWQGLPMFQLDSLRLSGDAKGAGK
jgi:ABC-type transport system substrate-binding protein